MRYLRWFGAVAGLGLVTFSGDARAHGGYPRAFEVIVEPGNSGNVVLRSDVWGLFHTIDNGKTWQWACAEVYGSDSLAVNHQNMLMTPGGRLFVANGFKGLHMTDDFCSWRDAPDFKDEFVSDVAFSTGPVGEFVLQNLFVLTSTFNGMAITGGLWRSTNRGENFARVGGLLPSTFAASSFKFSASRPQRIYVLGQIVDGTDGRMERSDDGGTTWTMFTVPITNPVPSSLMHLRLAAVHPTRPDVVFVWVDVEEGLGADEPDQLWATQDGGTTWRKIYDGAGDLPGFALSPDGTELVVAGPKEGVQRAKVDDALAQGQTAFTQEFGRQVWGLHWADTGFTAGTDNFTPVGLPAFTYGSSNDEGKSFNELMSICDVRYDACGATSQVRTACDSVYDNPLGGFRQDFTEGPRCVGSADSGVRTPLESTGGAPGVSPPGAHDGGLVDPSTSGGRNDLHIATGCDMSVGEPARRGAWSVVAAFGVFARRLRRRSRRV